MDADLEVNGAAFSTVPGDFSRLNVNQKIIWVSFSLWENWEFYCFVSYKKVGDDSPLWFDCVRW